MRRFFTIENLFFILFFFGSALILTINTNRQDRMMMGVKNSVASMQMLVGKASMGFRDIFYNFSELFSIRERYQNLQIDMPRYYRLEKDNMLLADENRRLRGALSLKDRIEYDYKMARIMAKDSSNLTNSIVVDKGSRDGILKDMNVVAYSHSERMFGLVGRVVEVYERSSRIMQIYDSTQYIAAKVNGKYYQGLVHGNGNLSQFASFNYVPLLALSVLKKGDIVLTSGISPNVESTEIYNSVYAEGFFIGRIADVDIKYNEGSSLSLPLESIVNFNALEYVYILKQKPQKISSVLVDGSISLLTPENSNDPATNLNPPMPGAVPATNVTTPGVVRPIVTPGVPAGAPTTAPARTPAPVRATAPSRTPAPVRTTATAQTPAPARTQATQPRRPVSTAPSNLTSSAPAQGAR